MIFPRQLKREIGRLFEGLEGSDFLNIGVMFASFHDEGNVDYVRSVLKYTESGLANLFAPSLMSLGLTNSGLLALEWSIVEMASLASLADIEMSEREEAVLWICDRV